MGKRNNNAEKPNQVYYMDEEGFQQFLSEIAELKVKLQELCATQFDESSYGDQLDTVIGESYLIKEQDVRNLHFEIEERMAKLPKIKIISKHNQEDRVDINDIVLINYGCVGDNEEAIVRLIGGSVEIGTEIKQVSLNSPMGKAIFGLPIGGSNTYKVGDRLFNITVIEKLNKKLVK